ncbi:methyltransferase domain-containing protein [Nocardioides sp. zg-ZUI104]|uniref:methyltransferase domain-containing protein n=1 Tax=Nocardioides faecalis TaxID=2803858 RepID=UPI001BCE0C71|nr:methyltransferase domain-containing protein [Nocardioides faecalis]MBS4753329.1 methyltransferase domain-containing protein [Nocardioides faecalis]
MGTAPGYSSSQYLDGVPPGSVVDGVRCEDLARLTFDDASIDILVTQDVLEHVMEPDRVLSETRRVLRSGGVHLATFPWYPELERSRVRASLSSTGEVVHHAPPEYHRSPVGDGSALVTIDWGADLFARAAAHGLRVEVHQLPQSRRQGIDGEFRQVFAFSALG